MIKLLIAGTVILLIAFGGIYLVVSQNKKPEVKISSSIDAPNDSTVPREVPKEAPAASSPSASSPQPSSASTPKPSSQTASIDQLEGKVASLEKSNTDLALRVAKLENQSSTQTSSTTSSKAPQYIYPTGYGGSATTLDWSTLSSYDITIDPSLYSGYTGMQLEVQVNLANGNGKGYVRLYNSTAGTAILSSEASTSSENTTWITSPNFTVSGKQSFKLQLKTLTGYPVTVSDLRVKVNF